MHPEGNYLTPASDENSTWDKKTHRKALIPLPPTGFVRFFCAIPAVVQTKLQPRRAVRLRRRSAISQCAKFCEEMQPSCTTAVERPRQSATGKAPDSLGEKLENIGLRGFLKTGGIDSEGKLRGCPRRGISLHLKLAGAYRQLGAFHRTARRNRGIYLISKA